MKIIQDNLKKCIFWSRWLQVPLYLGLIVILAAYSLRFLTELWTLVFALRDTNNTDLMLGVLDLIDVVMIANLLIMVVIGGYETFVSRLNLKDHPDNPEWLDELNAGTMKVKLALALVGISSIHLLRTFIDPSHQSDTAVRWQVYIHITLVISAIAIAWTIRIMSPSKSTKHIKSH